MAGAQRCFQAQHAHRRAGPLRYARGLPVGWLRSLVKRRCRNGDRNDPTDKPWAFGRDGPRPVAANAWGLFDMPGNVWEWCADWYDAAYYAPSLRDGPAGASAGSYRVSRGGGWMNAAGGCRAAYRCGWQERMGRTDCRGFRIARVVSLPSPTR